MLGNPVDFSYFLGFRIFSSLIGKKKSISALKHRLDSIDNIRYSFSTLEQGKTHRWVLLWSFQDVWLDQVSSFIPVHIILDM